MPNIVIIIITAVFFAFCTASLVYQAIYSVYFRKQIAIPHDFSEGIMTGVTYPLLWVMYGLIAVQFFSFIVFRTSDDIILAIRLIIFAVSVIAFAAFKTLTPALLAYWFGKTAFWDGKGEQGKIPYSDIYCIKVHKKKSSRFINNQQLYKITFYVKNKTFLLIPKKHVCKMTAKQISVLTAFVDFKECKKPHPTKKALIYSICLPILLFSILSLCFLQILLDLTFLWSFNLILIILLFSIRYYAIDGK